MEILRKSRIDSITSIIQIKATDKIADIGTGGGENFVKITLNSPASFYCLEDIDSNALNKRAFSNALIKYKSPLSIENFHFYYGNDTSTTLPNNTFDKIFLIAVYHEFDYPNQMMKDILKKLKIDGQLLIEEPLVKRKVSKIDKGCRHPYLTIDALLKQLEDLNITIVSEKNIPMGENGQMNYYRKVFLCERKTISSL